MSHFHTHQIQESPVWFFIPTSYSYLIKETVVSIKEALLRKPSMLHDKFCNSNNLCDVCQEMKNPHPNLEFLCLRFNVNHEHFYD